MTKQITPPRGGSGTKVMPSKTSTPAPVGKTPSKGAAGRSK